MGFSEVGAEASEDLRERPQIAALIDDMAQHGSERDGPVRAVMGSLGDRWTTLLLLVLTTGPARHAALRRVLGDISNEGGVSQRVMTLKLRTLERDGFVERTVSADVPPKVSYALTPLGLDLAGQARAMIDWVHGRQGEIEVARAAFDLREEG